MRRFVRREYTADYVALAYGLAYYAWLCLRPSGTPATLWIGEVSFYPLGLAVGWAYLRNARLPELDRRTRLAWGILGTSALALWVVGNTWPRLVNYFGASAYPSWVGILEIVQHALLIAAFLVFPARSLTSRDRLRFGADVGLILVAGFVLAFHYGARAAAAVSPVSPPVVAFAQSVLDWVVFVTAAAGVLHKRDGTTRGALLWLLAANTLYLTANYVLSGMRSYQLGDAVDGIWFAAWTCRWVAARFAWHRYREDRALGTCPLAEPVTVLRSGIFSYVLVAATFALLVGRVAAGEREHLALFTFSAAVMAGLLLIRQVVEQRENRRLFESQLAQEARFRSLIQNASDIVLATDESGHVSYVSPSADRILGPGIVVVGSRLADVIPHDDVAALGLLFGEPSRAVGRIQSRMRTAADGWCDVEIAATDMRAIPEVGGVVLTCRDVTDRNELERQLHHAQKLDAVGHLAGGLAHDFNNVLAAIRGYTELLREDLPPSSQATADLQHIEQSVDRAVAVTRKLLAFSRKETVQRVTLNLNSVLADLDPLLRQLLTDRIDVRTAYEPELWPIKADSGQMEQVIINLLTNARDAMPHGGRIEVGTENRSVTAQSQETGPLQPGDYVALIVSDHGTGIPDRIRHQIFEPFFSTKPKDRGIGLGLAMVHGIVSQSGGHITVESTEGRGTTLTVLLPRSAETAR